MVKIESVIENHNTIKRLFYQKYSDYSIDELLMHFGFKQTSVDTYTKDKTKINAIFEKDGKKVGLIGSKENVYSHNGIFKMLIQYNDFNF